jgi:hypothetical protein
VAPRAEDDRLATIWRECHSIHRIKVAPQGLVESSRGGIPETVRSQEPAAGATSLGRMPQPPPDQSGLPGSGGKFQRGTVLRARNDQPAIRPSRVCKATRPEGKCHNPSSPDQSGPLALRVWWRVPEAASQNLTEPEAASLPSGENVTVGPPKSAKQHPMMLLPWTVYISLEFIL